VAHRPVYKSGPTGRRARPQDRPRAAPIITD